VTEPTKSDDIDGGLNPAKAQMVSDTINRYGIRSVIDIGACWGVNGGYTFHALSTGKIQRAIILDGDLTRLTRQRAANDPRISLLQGDLGDSGFIGSVPRSDAAIVFDVLLHQVAPDWNEFLAHYSRKVDYFIIYNEDWDGNRTIRFIDEGLDFYRRHVPDADSERLENWFRNLDNPHPTMRRRWRDVHNFWQWGITTPDLIATMRGLGFELDWFNYFGPWSKQYPKIRLDGYLFRRQCLV
jgi:hypothetical protein